MGRRGQRVAQAAVGIGRCADQGLVGAVGGYTIGGVSGNRDGEDRRRVDLNRGLAGDGSGYRIGCGNGLLSERFEG